ncbi:MAG: hypothetical protein CDV28_14319 [Candidatus Electronema aureum]|uniref:Uncharacterized protein n=1 Tax=Candidatus Electronema aureum TaxID=2005002 RepID=A0A521FZ25_9BACT|nr:MAG: hypothetical protein CDV28_14319 [Candidatus Electronema aureum]
MLVNININQLSYHLLILRMMFLGFPFEEKSSLAECERHFDLFLLENKLFWRGKKVINDAEFAQRLIRCIQLLS